LARVQAKVRKTRPYKPAAGRRDAMLFLPVLVVLSIFLLSPLRIDLLYLRKDRDEDKLILTFRLFWGLVGYPVNVERASRDVSPRVRRTVKSVDPGVYLHLLSLIPKVKGRVKVKELALTVGFSLGDACLTGMAAGLLWSVAGNLLALMRDYFRLESTPRLAVGPSFTEEPFWHLRASGSLEITAVTLYRLLAAAAGRLLVEAWQALSRFLQRKIPAKSPIKEG
jgi:hypothetical protein